MFTRITNRRVEKAHRVDTRMNRAGARDGGKIRLKLIKKPQKKKKEKKRRRREEAGIKKKGRPNLSVSC